MTEQEEFEFRHRLESEQGGRAVKADSAMPFGDYAKGQLDAAGHFLSGMVAAPAAGIAGLASTVIPGVDSSDVVKAVQDKLTYEPKTKSGQEITQMVETPFRKLGEWSDAAGGVVTDKTGSPALGAVVNTGVQMLPSIVFGKGAGMLRNSAAENAAANSVKNATMRKAVESGYRIPPSELAQSAPAKAAMEILEGAGGKVAMQQTASILNNKTLVNAVRKDIGIPGEGQISAEELADAKQPHFDVYDEAGNVSPRAQAAKEAWRKANYEEKRQRNYYRRSGDPKAEDAADAAKADASAQMQTIESEAVAAGKPDLVQRLRDARVALGKIGTVERALNETTGEVSASSLKSAKDAGVPLQGGMLQGANLSKAFKNKLTQPGVIQPGVSKLDAVLGAAAAIAKGPKGVALTGIPYAVRRTLLSKPVQKMMAPPEKIEPMSNIEQLKRAAILSALQQSGEQ